MSGETESGERPTALIVDDEKEVADAYALRLRGLCDVRTVYDGSSALELLDGEDIDVVLLDRHMPGMSGDDVLGELDERGYDGRVIMITAIDPGFDVLDMPFDDYLCKPVEREDVRTAVTHQCTILGYETLGEYFSVKAKRSVLEAELPATELEGNDRYAELNRHERRLRQRVQRLLEDATHLFETFDGIGREGR